MGSPKALLPFKGTTFIDHIIQNAQSSGCEIIITVLGNSAEQILKNSALPNSKYVINRNPRQGMLSSIQIGLESLPDAAPGFLLLLVDHPLVQSCTCKQILETAHKQPGKIIIPEFAGKHGHPVYFDRSFFQELLDTPLQQSARSVIQKNKDSVIYLPVDDEGILMDIDTPQDLKQYGLQYS